MYKLLIVDDEPLVQIGIKSILNWNEFGIEVCGTAMNGKQAFEYIGEFMPEIVITDIRMPLMNGLELIKNCRELYGKLPLFIILTSYEDFSFIKEAIKYGIIDYLVKLELTAESLREVLQILEERILLHQYLRRKQPLKLFMISSSSHSFIIYLNPMMNSMKRQRHSPLIL